MLPGCLPSVFARPSQMQRLEWHEVNSTVALEYPRSDALNQLFVGAAWRLTVIIPMMPVIATPSTE